MEIKNQALKKPKSMLISSVDPQLRENLTTHLKKTGISISFYVQKAIAEKLERDSKSDEK